jgi:phage I-like protein
MCLTLTNVIQRRALSSLLADGEQAALPNEFQIFKAGANETTKGTFVFDAEAARVVMARYAQEGVELMVDLEHLSLDDPAAASRVDVSDARGWFRLELRGGELWATDVRWTPDGERRLREKTQRYISPAFLVDKETGRVSALLNVALVAMPATHEAPALVAAGRRTGMSRAACYAVICTALATLPKRKTKRRI